jgi:hypothetical protein
MTSAAEDYTIKRLKPSVPTVGRYPIHIYNDLLVAWLWDNMRTVRIHLLEVLKRCDFLLQVHHNAAKIEFESTGLEEDANAIIRDMVSDVCSTVPFFLGEVDSRGNIAKYPHILPLAGRMAMWSIYIAMTSSEPGSETESWLRSKLELINSSMGMRLAARLARRERKNPWDLR